MKTIGYELGLKGILVIYFYLLRNAGGSRGIKSTSANCSLPTKWAGSWSQAALGDAASPVMINESTMSVDHFVNSCVRSLQDNYIFKVIDGKHPPCYRCLIILEKHPNVIQYRQSDCDDEATFDDCADLPTDNPITSLYRIDAKRELCPFVGKRMTFGYTKEGRVCSYEASNNKSHFEACSDPSMLSLNYEGCHDVRGTEQLREKLICVGSWTEHSMNYFIAKVVRKTHGGTDGFFRCFTYAEVLNRTSTEVTGYQVSRSMETGSCSHEMTPTDGPWTYNFQVQDERFPPFPPWLDPDGKGESHWTALNLTFEFGIDVAGGKIQMRPTPVSGQSKANTTISTGFQFTVFKVENLTDSYASLEVIEIVECRRLPICMDLYRRSESVVEIELYHRAVQPDHQVSCHHQIKVNPHLTYTLVKTRARPVQCPLSQVFQLDVPPLSSHERHVQNCTRQVGPNAPHFLEVGCRGKDSSGLDFYKECKPGEPLLPTKALQVVSGLDCIGTWKEGDKTYIVADNSDFGVRGFRCLEISPGKNGATYSFYVSMDDCKPSSDRRLKNWTFNANPFAGCDYVQERRKENLESSAAVNILTIGHVICWAMTAIFIQ